MITAHSDDLDSPGFDAFLVRAATAFPKIGKGGTPIKASDLG